MTNVIDKMSDISPQSKSKDEDKLIGVKFFECEGFGHIKIECPAFLRKQKKGFSVALRNFAYENEGETSNGVITFTRKHEPRSESTNDSLNEEDLAATYRLLYTKWEEAGMTIEKHKITICVLHKKRIR